MEKRLVELEVENFRSLRSVKLPLGPLNVLVGPNGAGKTNVLKVFQFLADMVLTDLVPAVDQRGGFDELLFRGGEVVPDHFRIKLSAAWTPHAGLEKVDEYELRVASGDHGSLTELTRHERFGFPNPEGWRRIVVSDELVEVSQLGLLDPVSPDVRYTTGISRASSGLSTLPRLSKEAGAQEVRTLASRLGRLRVFDVSVDAARQPSRLAQGASDLRADAANLAASLLMLSKDDGDTWRRLEEDAIAVLPQLESIGFEYPSGAAHEVVVILHERGLRRPTQLADASYGTIRLLGLLALLYDPSPPALTCVEEIDHGLHPQALELLVERLREASERTQFLIATHSPAFADRLRPEELVICERRDDGSSAIPALSTQRIREIVAASEGEPLGELWFAGALGGDL
ncbi:AAA family ATPase [Streptosporangium sp. NPDC002721]|uniref:AAA family ATPase n=1 Tax=Streptosporangium sp. NPDC002721 TaxID=3366188 RepID=UPI00368F30AE